MRRIGFIVVISLLAAAAFAAPAFAVPHPPRPGKVVRKANRHAKKHVVRVRVAPPAPRVVVKTTAPSVRHVYVGGYWRWEPKTSVHVWVDPVWMLPPHDGEVWHPGHWEKDGDEWEWEEGEWESPEDHAEHARGE